MSKHTSSVAKAGLQGCGIVVASKLAKAGYGRHLIDGIRTLPSAVIGDFLDEWRQDSGAALISVRLGLDSKAVLILSVMQAGGLRTATSELRTLLERFANGRSMNIIFDAANALIDDANKDQELRKWFKNLNAYVRKVRTLLNNMHFPHQR